MSSFVSTKRAAVVVFAAGLLGQAAAGSNHNGHRTLTQHHLGQGQLRASGPALDSPKDSPHDAAHHVVDDEKSAALSFKRAAEQSFRGLTLVNKEAGDEQGEEQSATPVHMQVPEEEMDAMTAKLSSECRTQFSDILKGKSNLHTFSDRGAKSKADCSQLDGQLCDMNARVTQEAAAQGREMTSSTELKGKSCLPHKCMAQSDLQVLGEFMKLKAKESMGTNHEVSIDMKVDCSATGGSTILIGGSPSSPVEVPSVPQVGSPVHKSSAAPASQLLAATALVGVGALVNLRF